MPKPPLSHITTDYRRALSALAGWQHTAAMTGNPRHAATAETCRVIAIERLRAALTAIRAADAPRLPGGVARAPLTPLTPLTPAEQDESRQLLVEVRGELATLTAPD